MSGNNQGFAPDQWTRAKTGRRLAAIFFAAFYALFGTSTALAGKVDKVSTAGLIPDLVQDQIAVRELMQLEIEQALQRQRKSAAGAGPAQSGAGARARQEPGAPRLQAIYGVGQRLLAEVLWKGSSYIYLNGQLQPAGRKSETDVPRLKSISERCVTLQGSGRVFELCLGASGEEG